MRQNPPSQINHPHWCFHLLFTPSHKVMAWYISIPRSACLKINAPGRIIQLFVSTFRGYLGFNVSISKHTTKPKYSHFNKTNKHSEIIFSPLAGFQYQEALSAVYFHDGGSLAGQVYTDNIWEVRVQVTMKFF